MAFGQRAALLRGEPGAGKSDLALRFLALPGTGEHEPTLIADDQVWVEAGKDGRLLASAPETITGRMEVRGIGIVDFPFLAEAPLALVCDLTPRADVPRMPPEPWERTMIAGVGVPLLRLSAFEDSAALKLKVALLLVRQGTH